VSASATLKPHERLSTQLDLLAGRTDHGPRWVGSTLEPDGRVRSTFGDLHSQVLSLTLRQSVVLTPRLTVQVYAQAFRGEGASSAGFFAAALPGEAIRLSDLQPAAPAPGGDFRDLELTVNAVLRWEYAPGSTFFLVYTRDQASGAGATDQLMAKLTSYWLG
jgi:hypothetical protein